MSEFHVFEMQMDDLACLLEALRELGYNPLVYDKPQQLHGYQGDLRDQKAHIVIPRSQVGSASNDIGFEKVNGKYIMHLSEFDSHSFKTSKLKQMYNKSSVSKYIKKNRKLSVKSSEIKKDGSIAIKIKIGV